MIAGQQQLLAGSSLETDTCITHAMSAAGLSLRDAFDMAGLNPCRLLGVEQVRLRRGSQADLVVFRLPEDRSRIEWLTTVASGEVQFGSVVSAAV